MSFVRLFWTLLCVLRELMVDAFSSAGSCLRSQTALLAENLFLRKQLTFYREREIRPRRLTNAARPWLVFLSRFFAWRSALTVVKPATLIGWHRRAFRLFWKWKSRPGRRRIRPKLSQFIAQMVGENPIWGEERIAHELWLKLGIRVSPRTARTYWPAKDPWSGPSSQRWETFVRNHGLTPQLRRRCSRNRSGQSTQEQSRAAAFNKAAATHSIKISYFYVISTDFNECLNLVRDQGVGGSNPFSPATKERSDPGTWVTECTGHIGDSFGPKGFSSGSRTRASRSKYPKS